MTTTQCRGYGASRMAVHYATALADAGHQVRLVHAQPVSDDSQAEAMLAELEAAGVQRQHLTGMSRGMWPFLRKPLVKMARECSADAIISTQMRDAPAAMVAAAHVGIPGIVFAQNLPRFNGNPLAKRLKEKIYEAAVRRRASRIVCVAPAVSEAIQDMFHVPAEKMQVVLNGLDLRSLPAADANVRSEVRQEFRLPDDMLLLVTIGRIHEQKGLQILLEAYRILLKETPNCPRFHALIVGDVESDAQLPLRHKLQEFVRTHDLGDHVRFTGFRKDGFRLLQAADLMVLSSLWEGLPLVVLEAFAANCPVIMTEYGMRFAGFVDGRDGQYVPVENAPALAEGIAAILNHSADERQSIGQNGRKYLENNLTLERGKREFVAAVEDTMRQGRNNRH